MKRYIKTSWHWLILFLLTDAVFVFVTWIIRREAVKYMSLFIVLFTLFVLAAGSAAEFWKRRSNEEAFLNFLENPDENTKAMLSEHFGNNEIIRVICTRFLEELSLINKKTVELSEYREYIESWVHEIKTPLSLLTLVLNNHRDDISPYVYARLNYIQHQLNENAERILYYARLQSEHSDVKFTQFRLDECAEEAIQEYKAFIEENNIIMSVSLKPIEVISDRKIVIFILSQLLGNAVKYADESEGKIIFAMEKSGDKVYISIYNNGDGVLYEDMPFIFDKGFTGSYPNRRKATGMGLYLVQKYAEILCVKVQIDSHIPFESGFGIKLVFSL